MKKKIFKKMYKNLGVPKKIFETPVVIKSPSGKKMFRDAKRTLEEKRADPPRDSLKAWDESWVEYKNRIYHDAREALLFECVPDRLCPICGELRLESVKWCIITRRHLERFKDTPEYFEIFETYLGKVICRSCVKKFDYAAKHVAGRKQL